jgi:hypothetical protein
MNKSLYDELLEDVKILRNEMTNYKKNKKLELSTSIKNEYETLKTEQSFLDYLLKVGINIYCGDSIRTLDFYEKLYAESDKLLNFDMFVLDKISEELCDKKTEDELNDGDNTYFVECQNEITKLYCDFRDNAIENILNYQNIQKIILENNTFNKKTLTILSIENLGKVLQKNELEILRLQSEIKEIKNNVIAELYDLRKKEEKLMIKPVLSSDMSLTKLNEILKKEKLNYLKLQTI